MERTRNVQAMEFLQDISKELAHRYDNEQLFSTLQSCLIDCIAANAAGMVIRFYKFGSMIDN